jgi:hypothetical protein
VTDDPDATRIFTLRETLAYNPRQCPHCGKRSLLYSFVTAASMAEPQNRYRRGKPRCENIDCPINTDSATAAEI